MTSETPEVETTVEDTFASYTTSLQSGLDNGLQYVKLFDKLVKTTDFDELLSASEKLADFSLDTEFLSFPHQFSGEDVQTLFFSRVLELGGVSGQFQIKDTSRIQKLLGSFKEIDDEPFTFVSSPKAGAGYFFTATNDNQPLMYLNLKTKELLFNGRSLIDFFVVALEGKETAKVKGALTTLKKFGKILKEKAGFTVDFNVLDSFNGEFFEFAGGNVSEEIMDELFVKSAENDYILMADESGNATLDLDATTKLVISDQGTDEHHRYGAYIQDHGQTENWIFLLLDYEFLQKWYLRNEKQLEILSNQVVFG
ncbi:hypothetical protein PL11_008700 [Lentilactobacillus curieae]|uniref:Uncharacterized protein n=1 Tax=Lentilactobacillus curieae TaxID=1138822 RepID=A0A1S6QK74_9LACO|nr:hypothetical protein [Lentilactobacillus curieae]AQW21990.1 hypothetical protein PL11_008700 [Lentilactobacillus curieae]